MRNFLISLGIGALYIVVGFLFGLVVWLACAMSGLELGVWGWALVSGVALLVSGGLYGASTSVDIVPGQQCQVRFRGARFALMTTDGRLLLPPGFTGLVYRVTLDQKSERTVVVEQLGFSMPLRLRFDIRITDFEKALEQVDTDKGEGPETLIASAAEILTGAMQDYTNQHPVIKINVDEKDPSKAVVINREILSEGLRNDDLMKSLNGHHDKDVLVITPDPETVSGQVVTDKEGKPRGKFMKRTMKFYDCLEAISVIPLDIEVPPALLEKIASMYDERFDAMAKDTQMDKIMLRLGEAVDKGVTEDVAFDALMEEFGEQKAARVSKTIIDTGAGGDGLVAAAKAWLTRNS